MTKDEIIEMAQECRLIGMRPHLDGIYSEALVAFAKLVAEAEREKCAKVCDVIAQKMDDEGEGPTGNICWVIDCAEAIRARGQA